MRRMKSKFAPKVAVPKAKGSSTSATSQTTSSNTTTFPATGVEDTESVSASDLSVNTSSIVNTISCDIILESTKSSTSSDTTLSTVTLPKKSPSFTDAISTNAVTKTNNGPLPDSSQLSKSLSVSRVNNVGPSLIVSASAAAVTNEEASAVVNNVTDRVCSSVLDSIVTPSTAAASSSAVVATATLSTPVAIVTSVSVAAVTSSAPVAAITSSAPVAAVTSSAPVAAVTTSAPVATVTTSAPVATVTTSAPVATVTPAASVSSSTAAATVSLSSAAATVSSSAGISTATSSAAVVSPASPVLIALSSVIPPSTPPSVPFRRSRLSIKPKTKINSKPPTSFIAATSCEQQKSSTNGDSLAHSSNNAPETCPTNMGGNIDILCNEINNEVYSPTENNLPEESSCQKTWDSCHKSIENSNESKTGDSVPLPTLTPPKTTENSPERSVSVSPNTLSQNKMLGSNSLDENSVPNSNADSCLTPPKENLEKLSSSALIKSGGSQSDVVGSCLVKDITSEPNNSTPDDTMPSGSFNPNPLSCAINSKLSKGMPYRKKMKVTPNLVMRKNKINPKINSSPANVILPSENVVMSNPNNVGSESAVQNCNGLQENTENSNSEKNILGHSTSPPSQILDSFEKHSSSSVEHNDGNFKTIVSSVVDPAKEISESSLCVPSETIACVSSNHSANKKVGKLTKENLASVSCNKENVHSNRLPVDRDDSMSVCSVETTEEARLYWERKQKFREKLTEGALERNLTMFDLIYFNPDASPMPGREKVNPAPRGRKRLLSNTASSVAGDEQREEEEAVDDAAPAADEETQAETVAPRTDPESAHGSADEAGEPENNGEDNEEDEFDVLAPQLKIGPNGEVIIDQKSLLIKTSNEEERLNSLSNEVVEETENTRRSYTKKRKRASDWSTNETAYFYKALSTVGTDFQLMHDVFFKKWRTREEVKTKYKKEERINKALVDAAISEVTQYDLTVFETEPEFDPAAERASAREAEREEQRERKRAQQLLLQQERLKERDKRRTQKMADKTRKKVLRDNLSQKRKRQPKRSYSDEELDNSMEEYYLDESNLSGNDNSPASQSVNSATINATIDYVINSPSVTCYSPQVRTSKKRSQPRKSNCLRDSDDDIVVPYACDATSSTPVTAGAEGGGGDAPRRSARVKKPRKLASFVETFNDSASDIDGDDDDCDYVAGEELQEGEKRKKGKNMDNFAWGGSLGVEGAPKNGQEEDGRRLSSDGDEELGCGGGSDGEDSDDPLHCNTNAANISTTSLGESGLCAVMANPSAYLSSISLLDASLQGVPLNDSSAEPHPLVGGGDTNHLAAQSSTSRGTEATDGSPNCNPNSASSAILSPVTARTPNTKGVEQSPAKAKRKRGRPAAKPRQRKNVIYSESSGTEEGEEESEDEGLQDTDRLKVMEDTGSTIKLQLQGIRLDQLTCDHPVKLGRLNKAERVSDGASGGTREDSGGMRGNEDRVLDSPPTSHHGEESVAVNSEEVCNKYNVCSDNHQRQDIVKAVSRSENGIVTSDGRTKETNCSMTVMNTVENSNGSEINITLSVEPKTTNSQEKTVGQALSRLGDSQHSMNKIDELETKTAGTVIKDVVCTDKTGSGVSDTAVGCPSDDDQAPFEQQPIVFTDPKNVHYNTSSSLVVKTEADCMKGMLAGRKNQSVAVSRRPKLKLAPKLKPALARVRLAAVRGLPISEDGGTDAQTTSFSTESLRGERNGNPIVPSEPVPEMGAEVTVGIPSADSSTSVSVREPSQALKTLKSATVDVTISANCDESSFLRQIGPVGLVLDTSQSLLVPLVQPPKQAHPVPVTSLADTNPAIQPRTGKLRETQTSLSFQQGTECQSVLHEGPVVKRLRASESTVLHYDATPPNVLQSNQYRGAMACEGISQPMSSSPVNSRRRSFNPESLKDPCVPVVESLVRRNSTSSNQVTLTGKDQNMCHLDRPVDNHLNRSFTSPSRNTSSTRPSQLAGIEIINTNPKSIQDLDTRSLGKSAQMLDSDSCLEIRSSRAFADSSDTLPNLHKRRNVNPPPSQSNYKDDIKCPISGDAYSGSSAVCADQENTSRLTSSTAIDAEECDASDCTIIDTRNHSREGVACKVEIIEESSMDDLDTAKLDKFFSSGKGSSVSSVASSAAGRRNSCSSNSGRVTSSIPSSFRTHQLSRQQSYHDRTPCRSPLQPLQVQTRPLVLPDQAHQSTAPAERLHSPRMPVLASPHYRSVFRESSLEIESQLDRREHTAGPSVVQLTSVPRPVSYEQRLFTDPVKKEVLVQYPSDILVGQQSDVVRSNCSRRHDLVKSQQLRSPLIGHKTDISDSRPSSRVEVIEISSDCGRSSSVLSSSPHSRMSVSSMDDPLPVRPLSCISAEVEGIPVRSLHYEEPPSRPASVVMQSPINFVNVCENDPRMCKIVRVQSESLPPPSIRQSPLIFSNDRYSPHIALPARHSPHLPFTTSSSCHSPHTALSTHNTALSSDGRRSRLSIAAPSPLSRASSPYCPAGTISHPSPSPSVELIHSLGPSSHLVSDCGPFSPSGARSSYFNQVPSTNVLPSSTQQQQTQTIFRQPPQLSSSSTRPSPGPSPGLCRRSPCIPSSPHDVVTSQLFLTSPQPRTVAQSPQPHSSMSSPNLRLLDHQLQQHTPGSALPQRLRFSPSDIILENGQPMLLVPRHGTDPDNLVPMPVTGLSKDTVALYVDVIQEPDTKKYTYKLFVKSREPRLEEPR